MQAFNDLDVQLLDRELDLKRRGRDRGESEQPITNTSTWDSVESEVIEHIGAAQKRAYDELQAQLATFHERLTDLDFESRFGAIEEVAHGGLADLKAEQQMALDDLHGLRKDLAEAETSLAEFKKEHKLRRPAEKKSALGQFVKLLVIGLLVVGELVANGYFLSGGNELGLIGGFVEALLFSALNVGVAIFVALVLLPNLYHRNFFRKLFGVIALFAFFAWAAGLNLGLAHYREAAGTREPTIAFTEQARDAVVERLLTRPLELDQFESWLLFAIGVLFALVALIDGLSLVDRYPGYQKFADTMRKARQAYADQRRAKILDLSDVRQEYQDAVSELRIDIAKRRTEHQAISAHRLKLLNLFQEHQAQLEKAANQLLRIYRDANIETRSSVAPSYFEQSFKLDRLVGTIEGMNEITSEALQQKINDAQVNLQTVMADVTAEFERGLERYRELDVLAPDAPNAAA
jgi:Skp family chaperone for outer membrane proteins